jgi:hypothetical protein
MKMSNDRLRFRRARAGNHGLAAGVRLRPTWRARWQAWLTDDGPPELAFYCPDCAERNSARTDARARDASEADLGG